MSLVAAQLQELERHLADLKEGLAVDGYELTVRPGRAQGVRVHIEALEGACEDCLIPKSIFLDYLMSAFDGQVTRDQVELFYPGESPDRS